MERTEEKREEEEELQRGDKKRIRRKMESVTSFGPGILYSGPEKVGEKCSFAHSISRCSSVQFTPLHFRSVRFGSVQLGLVRLSSVRFSSGWFSSVRFISPPWEWKSPDFTDPTHFLRRKVCRFGKFHWISRISLNLTSVLLHRV